MKKFFIFLLLSAASAALHSQEDRVTDFYFSSISEEIDGLLLKSRNLDESSATEKLQLSLRALEMSRTEGMREREAEALATMGVAYYQLLEIDKSLEALTESYDISLKFGFDENRFYAAYHLGILHRYLDNDDRAIVYFTEGRNLAGNDISPSLIALLSQLASLNMDLGDYIAATDIVEEALLKAEELGNTSLELELILLAGEISLGSGDRQRAVGLFLDIVRMTEDGDGNGATRAAALSLLGRSYAHMGNFTRALSYGQDSLLLASADDSSTSRLKAYGSLSFIYERMGDYEKAFEYLRLYYGLKEKMEQSRNSRNLNSIKAYYGTFEKEREIDQQTLLIQNQNRLILAGSLMLLALAALLLFFYFLYRKNSRIAEKLSRDLKREMVISKTDPLTGLPNRRDLDDRLQRAVGQWKKNFADFSLMFISFEDHRKMDKTMGGGAGEKFQRKLGDILKSVLKGQDVVAIWKPFVYAVLLPETGEDSLKAVTLKLSTKLEETLIILDEEEIPLSFRIGSCTYSGEGNRSDCIDQCREQLKA